MSHEYPTTLPSPAANPPWIKILGGKPLSRDSALPYVYALKNYVASDMRTLLLSYEKWDAAKAGWYNLPWLYSIQDPIHGTYIGSAFQRSMFPLSGLKTNMTTLVLVYYNDIAGYTVGRIWGKDAMHPKVENAQYKEGAVIVKVALTTATSADWSPLEGTVSWDICAPLPKTEKGFGIPENRTVFKAALFQFDIIVKDSKAAPKTGWVFSTLVYDKREPGDVWDKMVPLGAIWGNDRDVNSTVDPNAILEETVVNPMAPLYATETLGYGGRLSGPNDGAVVQNAIIDGQLVPRVRASSCMSCHGVAERRMKSFLLPGPGIPTMTGAIRPATQRDLVYLYKPGSVEWSRWFQSRAGDEPQDEGLTALDYHMNLAYKALPLWAEHTHQDRASLYRDVPRGIRELLMAPESSTQNGLLLQGK